MHPILVYADSLSWGIIPNTRQRLEFESRWPGVLEQELIAAGHQVRVIEDCLNGRRTVWEDPFKPGRNGAIGLEQRIEINMPLSLVILLLGTNDFQSMHPYDASLSAQGIATIVQTIRRAPIEPGMQIPPILIVVPPRIENPKGPLAWKFKNAGEKSLGLAQAYEEVARTLGCSFFDSSTVTTASKVDGIHLDEDQHLLLGRQLAKFVLPLITSH
jgi:lysophospholipase L1-like esterase